MEEVLIPLIVFGTMFAMLYVFLTTRNKERLALIEKGADAKFSTWLYKIVYNTALSRFRKKQIESYSMEESSMIDSVHEQEDDGLDILHHQERKKIISTAIGRLKEDEGVAMTLFYLSENSIKEIEEITGFTNSNIKILLFRGRNNLLFEMKKILNEEIVDIL
jgi:RNA polymerase sigma factor (sigma-70 family)